MKKAVLIFSFIVFAPSLAICQKTSIQFKLSETYSLKKAQGKTASLAHQADSQVFVVGKEQYALVLRELESKPTALELVLYNNTLGLSQVIFSFDEELPDENSAMPFKLSSVELDHTYALVEVASYKTGKPYKFKFLADVQPFLPEAVKKLIPQSWQALESATGDLNKDSIDDVAVVIEKIVEDSDEAPRALLALFQKKDKTYELACRADKGIMAGDYFTGISVNKNVIRIDHFNAQGRGKWETVHRFRYQNGDFFMIGATHKGSDGVTGSTYNYDFNLSNGKMIVQVTDTKDPKKNKNETKVLKLPALPKLKDFEPFSLDTGNNIRY